MTKTQKELLYLFLSGIAVWFFLPERYSVNPPVKIFSSKANNQSVFIEKILSLPSGFEGSLYSNQIKAARMLRTTANNDLIVSQPTKGNILLLAHDNNNDGKPDEHRVLLDNLNLPHGIDIHKGWLYVAETNAVGRIRFDENTGRTEGEYQHIVTQLPGGGNHWSRTLKFGPDGWAYLSIGSSCNACEEFDPRRAAIVRFKADGSEQEIYASGLRNAVGFDWQPETNVLFATENGRDYLGDDLPPDELNKITQGGFYGWPFAYGNRIADSDYGEDEETAINDSLPPVHEFGAHTAALGMTFISGESLPTDYQGSALVALHGSWNRSEKQGYQVVSLHFLADGKIEQRPFLSGFEKDEAVIGRPVDVTQAKDGTIYVSDDYSGSIYRIKYQPQ